MSSRACLSIAASLGGFARGCSTVARPSVARDRGRILSRRGTDQREYDFALSFAGVCKSVSHEVYTATLPGCGEDLEDRSSNTEVRT